ERLCSASNRWRDQWSSATSALKHKKATESMAPGRRGGQPRANGPRLEPSIEQVQASILGTPTHHRWVNLRTYPASGVALWVTQGDRKTFRPPCVCGTRAQH